MDIDTNDIPESFLDPILCTLMTDPVIDPTSGKSFDRVSILKCLSTKKESPISRLHLDESMLIPNHSLRDSIEEFIKLYKDGAIHPIATNPVVDTTDVVMTTTNNVSFSENDVTIDIVASQNVALITVNPPTQEKRMPCDICAVVDVSGSMGERVIVKTEHGSTTDGLSQLDIVKHALRTIIATLSQHDSLTIVAYSDWGNIVLDRTSMTDSGKHIAYNVVSSLSPHGQTNLWDGMYKGMEVMKTIASNNKAMFLLTDGVPNIEPPMGHIPKLEEYIDKNGLPCVLNTFGFGYALNSQLLNSIAKRGGGTYAFIPDGTFVGTIFVNAISNMLVTYASNMVLQISGNGDPIMVNGGYRQNTYQHQSAPNTFAYVNIGSLLYGQPRHVIVSVNPNGTTGTKNYLSVKINYMDPISNRSKQANAEGVQTTSVVDKINTEYVRHLLPSVVDTAMAHMESNCQASGMQSIRDYVGKIHRIFPVKSQYITDLLKDISGQITEAISKNEWYHKWGRHYLPSLMCAHLYQQCNNFKDPGVQHYGGKLFESIRSSCDEIFCKIPPPKANISAQKMRSNYYNSRGVCIHGSSIVATANKMMRVEDLRSGMHVQTTGGYAKIKCVIRTKCANGKENFVAMTPQMLITPWHPIKVNSVWTFPADVSEIKTVDCDYVYNFVLESNHTMIIDGIECATLGHGFTDNDVIKHEYFGTQKIIDDLTKLDGWNIGFIDIDTENVIRSDETGLVNGFLPPALVA